MPTVPALIVVEQRFNRAALGALWARRAELDPGQMMLVKSLYDNRKKGKVEGILRSEYSLANSNAGRLGYGRMYGSKGSFETLEREIRGTICAEFYHDIDVKNAHPVIMHQYAKRVYAFDMPETRKLCENRDAYLKRISPNRDEAKTAIIKVLYFGKNEHPFLEPWRLEIGAFAKILGDDPAHAELLASIRRQKGNTWGSFVSEILQTEERYIMLTMRESLMKRGWSVDVLAYDGVMIRKREDAEVDDDLLHAVEEEIKDGTGYDIELLDKPFDVLEVEPEGQMIDKDVSVAAYNERKAEFEADHFYFPPSNTIATVARNGSIEFRDLQSAGTVFNTYDFFHGKEHEILNRTSFLIIWLKDPKRVTYDWIDFKPRVDARTYIKKLEFAYERDMMVRDDHVVELWNRLLDLTSGGRPALRDYMIKWFAHLLQKPLDLPGVSLVLTGPKGCGKDTLADFVMKYVVGDQYASNYESNEQFFEKHDTGRYGKFLVKLEEANRFQCLRNADKLKGMITSDSTTVNPKGEKAQTTSNYTRFIFTSNSGNPFEMSQGERRFVMLPCSGEMAGKHDFWNDVRSTLFNAAAGRVIGQLLLGVDIDGFNPRTLPVNEYQAEVIESETTIEQRFFEAWNGETCSAAELFEMYERFCMENRVKGCDNSMSLGKRLLPMSRDGLMLKKHTKTGPKYCKA
jgi:hypothetical protein